MKSLISLFNRPFIFRQTFLCEESLSDSSPELSLSATNMSTHPSGRGSSGGRAWSEGFIRLVGLAIGASGPVLDGGRGRDVDEVGRAWYPHDR